MDNSKRVGVLTVMGNYNYGNKLQLYALCTMIKELGLEVNPIWVGKKSDFSIKNVLRFLARTNGSRREQNFRRFNNRLDIRYYNEIDFDEDFDYFVVGSDQVWNYNDPLFDAELFFGRFTSKEKLSSYAASMGVDYLTDNVKEIFREGINHFRYVSVREKAGAEVLAKLTGRKDIKTLVDPTMLLAIRDWDKIATRPRAEMPERYILMYFLGGLSEEKRAQVADFAKLIGCEVVDVLDKNSIFHQAGPEEFVFLEKHATLVCTNSFHACVFATLYHRPFLIYGRDDRNLKDMSSRLKSLTETFKLKKVSYTGELSEANLEVDFSNVDEILRREYQKSKSFLKEALEA